MLCFRSSWTADAQTLAGQLEVSCPAWAPMRETLMDDDAMVKAMCDNKAYGSLAVVARELKKYLKLIRPCTMTAAE